MTIPFLCQDGVVKVSFARDKILPSQVKDWNDLLIGETLEALTSIAHRVTITIRSPETKNKEVQLTMPVADAMEIFGGEVPSDANFTRICRRFLDRKHHGGNPLPSEPAERSMSAQGQTKKPGSHSEGRHG
jgi:hypothetical protein